MIYEYLNIYLDTKLLFEQKFTQEECTSYSQLSAFADQYLILKFLFELVSINSLPLFLQTLHIALDHIIQAHLHV